MTIKINNPDDPNRCHGTDNNGQCRYVAVPGSNFCEYHKGMRKGGEKAQASKGERYLIDQQELRRSYLRQQDDQDYLSLKDEILLVQAVLERRLNSIRTDVDVQMAVGPVSQLIQRLESMKLNLMKIQQQLGLVLGKDQLRSLARNMAEILDHELDGIEDKEDRMERICEKLFEAIEDAGKPTDTE